MISCWICVEYSGSRVASWATPMTSPKISPSRIAKMTMTRVRLASQRGAPFRIIQPRIGFTVTVSTTARKIGARMPGTWWIPAATTTAAAKPRMMIKPRGRPDVPCPEVGDGGSEFRESSAAAGSWVLGGVSEAGSAGLSVIVLSSVLLVCCRCRRGDIVGQADTFGRWRRSGSAVPGWSADLWNGRATARLRLCRRRNAGVDGAGGGMNCATTVLVIRSGVPGWSDRAGGPAASGVRRAIAGWVSCSPGCRGCDH